MIDTEETIQCAAVGAMLDKRLEEYKDALASGAEDGVITKMEQELDAIESVHDKCKDVVNEDIADDDIGDMDIDEE